MQTRDARAIGPLYSRETHMTRFSILMIVVSLVTVGSGPPRARRRKRQVRLPHRLLGSRRRSVPGMKAPIVPWRSRNDLRTRSTVSRKGRRNGPQRGVTRLSIFRAMQGRFKPLIDAGKVREAEAELDRVLDLLDKPGQKRWISHRLLPGPIRGKSGTPWAT